jgi:hypothetical protein
MDGFLLPAFRPLSWLLCRFLLLVSANQQCVLFRRRLFFFTSSSNTGKVRAEAAQVIYGIGSAIKWFGGDSSPDFLESRWTLKKLIEILYCYFA